MAMEKLLNRQMHGRARPGSRCPIIIPTLFDFRSGLPKVFALWPFRGRHHFCNNGVRVKMGKELV